MDVATVKKNYVDAAPGAKSNAEGASQLMGDFSAAVAERMKLASNLTAGSGKNSLISSLASKPDMRPKASPQDDDLDVAAPAQRQDKLEPREREKIAEVRTDAPRHEDVAPTDAPRETHQEHAPSDHGDDTSHDDTAQGQPSNDHSANEDGSEGQTAQSGENNATNETAVTEGQVAAVQQVSTGEVAQALTKDPKNAETVKAAAVDTSGTKQKSQKGPDAGQNALAGQANTDDVAEGPELLVKDAKSKGKGAASQAKNTANTHLRADAQAGAEKGPTLAQQQAADLSKKVGTNQPLNVNVNVTKQSEELVSQPLASLAGKANVKADGESLTPTTVQAAAKGQAQNVGTHNSGGQAGADTQGQNQQQAQFQAAQADAAKIAANATEAKTAQNAASNTTTQTTKVGGAEGTSSTQVATPGAATQQTQQTQQAAAKPTPTPHQQAHTPATEQVKIQISKAISDGIDKIRIQLKPAHLGRVEVQLEMSQDGRVSAVISTDNKDTMDMLKQDSRELERALREAGLNLNSGDLSFNMRGENGAEAGEREMAQGKSAPAEPIMEPTLDELLAMQPGQRQIITDDRVDITA